MCTFQWSILTARRGKASRARLSSLISAVSIIFAFFICLASGTQVYAADDPQSFEAPDNTAQAWVDVEATNVSAAGITGKMSDKTLTFKSSPSGVTAVIKTQAGAQNLVLQSQKAMAIPTRISPAIMPEAAITRVATRAMAAIATTPTPICQTEQSITIKATAIQTATL